MKLSYREITESAIRTVRLLSREAAFQLNEENQSNLDMARGVVQFWELIVGDLAAIEDRALLNRLVDQMACHADALAAEKSATGMRI